MPLMTASRSAPAARSEGALSGVIPPIATRGRYYIKQHDDGIAEPRYDAQGNASITVYRCLSCREEYERPDVMHSHRHQGAICSLCKSME